MKILKEILLIIIFISSYASSQTYKNVRAIQDGLSITVQYDMNGRLFRNDQVALTYSIDDGKKYSIALDAEGDIGSDVLPGKNNEINWLLIDKDFIIGKIISFILVTESFFSFLCIHNCLCKFMSCYYYS